MVKLNNIEISFSNSVYNCEEIQDFDLDFNEGYFVELISKVIKWFFIK